MKIHFSSNNSLISRAICWWTSAPVSHVAIEIDGEVYEALAEGFVKSPVEDWQRENNLDVTKVIETFEVSLPYPDRASDWLDQELGAPYDYPGFLDYLGFPLKQLPANLYCSEAARLAIIRGGISARYQPMHPGALYWFLIGRKSASE